MKPKNFETSFFVGQPLKVLIVEDAPAEAERYVQVLKNHGYKVGGDIVSTEDEFTLKLSMTTYDVVIANWKLPGWTGMQVLDLLGKLQQQTPFILITNAMEEAMAATMIDQGADDYVLSDGLQRLPLTVRRVLREQRLFNEIKTSTEERERLIVKLQDTLTEVKRLNGLLPICISCKRVLNAEGFWSRIEFYIERYSDARVSPSLCPTCSAKEQPEQHYN